MSSEKIFTALKGEAPDRVPVLPLIGDYAARRLGLPFHAMYRDAETASNAHLKALEHYGYDAVTIQVEPSWPLVEACGGEVTYPVDKCPWVTRPPISSLESLNMLRREDLLVVKTIQTMIKGTSLLASKSKVPVGAFIPGPLSFTFQLMSFKEAAKKLLREKETVRQILGAGVKVLRGYLTLLKEAGASFAVISEHDAQLVSPLVFKEFSLPNLPPILEVFDLNMLHMCGSISQHVSESLATILGSRRVNMLSVSSETSIRDLRALLGRHVGVSGNIDHVKLLPKGAPWEVEDACRRCLEEGKAGGGFVLSPGCEMPVDTPSDNVLAFVRSAEKYGRY